MMHLDDDSVFWMRSNRSNVHWIVNVGQNDAFQWIAYRDNSELDVIGQERAGNVGGEVLFYWESK